MKKIYLFKFSIFLLMLFSTVAYSQYFEPVPATGFNVDGVAETAPATSSTNSSLDFSDNVIYTKTYAVGGSMAGGLPDNGIVNLCFDNYQFAPYNQNNVLYLGGSQTGTLTFNTPKAYTTLNVVGFGSNGTKGFTSVVNFTDGTSQTITGFNFPDWDYYVAPDFILSGFGRSLRSPDYVSYTTAVNMHKVTLDISAANQTKLVASVTFTADSNSSNHISIMAVSGIPYTQVPITGQCGAVVNYSLPSSLVDSKPRVLLLAFENNSTILNDVKVKLDATNEFTVVDTHNLYTQGIPSLAQLIEYNAILYWGNTFHNGATGVAVVLKSYIDAGGGVVEGAYSNALATNLPAGYNFFSSPPTSYFYPTSTLGSVALPAHPIMNGVTAFSNTGAVHFDYTLAPSAYLVASYSNGGRLAVAMENVGPTNARRALLLFSPPSKDVLTNSWDSSTNGARLMANALKWVTIRPAQTSGLVSGSIFPVGTTTNTFTYTDSNNIVQTCSFDIVVNDTEAPVAMAKNIEVTLTSGAAVVNATDVNNGSTDNCGTPTVSLNTTSFDQTNIGSNLVTLTATDASGNTATTTAIVTVLPQDYQDVTVSNTIGQCGAIVNYATPTFNVIKPKILLLFHDTIINGEVNDVKAKLIASGQFDVIDILDLSVTTPTLIQLRQYDAILAWNNNVSSDPAAVGNLLADYIDLGGGLADAIFDNAADNFLGRFNTADYRVLMPAPQASGTVRTLGTILLPAHPIVSGITTFNAGPQSYVSTSTTIAPTSYIVANYDNNLPLIVAKENTGLSAAKRVSLNFFPSSTTHNSAGWDAATQGAQIMTNALKWAAKRIPVQTAGLPAGSLFPEGLTTNTFEYTDSNNVVHTFSFDVIVNDTEDPVIACIANADVTNCDGTFTYIAPTFTDNCTGATVAQTAGLASGAVYPVGVTTNTFVVTDASGNTATCSFSVTRNADLSATTSQVDVLCNGNATGSASVVAAGGTGTGTYTYLWSNGETTDAITNITAGNYSVTITDDNGCELVENFTITEPDALSQIPSQEDVKCFGETTGTAEVVVAGGTTPYTYLWSDGQTTAQASGLIAGNYSVTITDDNGCELIANFTITEPTAPLSQTSTQEEAKCFGEATGTAEVVVTGGTTPYTYLWSDGQTTAEASGLIAGNYDVTITDDNGCELTASFIITEPTDPLSQTSTQEDVKCFGEATGTAEVVVTGGTTPYTYLWSDGQTTAEASGLIAGNYDVTITDDNGCELTASFIITEPTAPLSQTPSQEDVKCFGEATGTAQVVVTGGTSPYTYLWSDGQTTAEATGLIAGNYDVTITDDNGCELTASFIITEPTAPLSQTPSQEDVKCFGEATGTAEVVVTGGTSPYTYLWSDGQTTAEATGLIAGNYDVTITDDNGCELIANFTITQPVAPLSIAPNTTQVDILCYGEATGSATVAVNGGTTPYTYLWSDGQTTVQAVGLIAGNYSVIVTDYNGCTITENFTLTQPLQPLALTQNTTQVDILCYGDATGSATVAVNGGTAPYTYLWSNGQTTAQATSLVAGNYSVTITDDNGCELTGNFTLTQPAAPLSLTPNTTHTNVLCHGGATGSATVAVTGGTAPYTYLWNSGQTTPIITGLIAGNYTVMVTDNNGCTLLENYIITEPEVLAAAITHDNVSCFGGNNGTATANVTGGTAGYTYSWNTTPVQTTATATGLIAGTYTVNVTDANDCTTTAIVTVTQPAAALGITTAQTNVSCFAGNDGALTINVTGGTGPYTYVWTPAVSTTNTATGLTVGNYKVVVTDANGCTDLRYLSLSSPTLLTGNVIVTNISCNGYDNGSGVVTVSGGVAPYTYLWSDGSTLATHQNLAPGIHTVVVTDAHNCTFTSSITITEPAAIVLTSQPDDVTVDAGQTAVFAVAAQNALLYQWQVSTNDGQTWLNVANGGTNPHYTGATASTLTVSGIPAGFDGYLYRAVVSQQGTCYVFSDDALLTVIPPVAAIEDIRKLSMSLYPNPASTEVFVTIPDFASFQNLKIAMYDLNGRLVRNEHAITADNYRIDVTGLESGVYIITISSDAGRTDKKVIVNKRP